MKRFEINENDQGQRLDRFVSKAMPDLPKSMMYRLIRKKDIKLNGKRCEISSRLCAGDVVTVYVKDEVWHKDQKMEVSDDDSLVLEVPYASEKELSGQILRLGEHAKVLAPESLRRYVQQTLQGALSQYLTDKPGR
jgi:23S rRNA-/tRNA-specific pseudouridylate synthase